MDHIYLWYKLNKLPNLRLEVLQILCHHILIFRFKKRNLGGNTRPMQNKTKRNPKAGQMANILTTDLPSLPQGYQQEKKMKERREPVHHDQHP